MNKAEKIHEAKVQRNRQQKALQTSSSPDGETHRLRLMVLLTDFTRERKGKEPYLSGKSTQRYGHVVDLIHDDVFVIVINL